MSHFTLGHRLPHVLAAPLFGDRVRFGLVVQEDDPCWKEWQERMPAAYDATQKQSVGTVVNASGYRVMRRVPLDGRTVLEIGPGPLDHVEHWQGRPARFVAADVQRDMLRKAEEKLRAHDVPHEAVLLGGRDAPLPFADGAFDVVVSFYSLEHLYPLADRLAEMLRVLRPGGLLAGAIPTEGGLAWGTGRFLTSRRWFHANTTIDPDKIICWEHPNFADAILQELDARLRRHHLGYWPLRVPLIDVNLTVAFVYEKPA